MATHRHWEINVSGLDHGHPVHLFATHPRSLTSERETVAAYREIKARFPEPEFEVSVTYWPGGGEDATELIQELCK